MWMRSTRVTNVSETNKQKQNHQQYFPFKKIWTKERRKMCAIRLKLKFPRERKLIFSKEENKIEEYFTSGITAHRIGSRGLSNF